MLADNINHTLYPPQFHLVNNELSVENYCIIFYFTLLSDNLLSTFIFN